MKTYFTTAITACLGIILLTPLTTHASITGHAYRFGNQQALYLIEFSFVTKDNDYYIPVRAMNYPQEIANTVTYDVANDMVNTLSAATASLVLSNQPVVDGHYHIPAGETGEFTLVVFAEIDNPDPLQRYRVDVNALPHLIGTKKTKTEVSDTALDYLTTPGIQFPLVIGGGK